jgi:hypothetical protein
VPAFASEELRACDKTMNLTVTDSQSEPAESVQALFWLMENVQPLHSIVGPARSGASIPTAVVAGLYDIPTISYWATSPRLDRTSDYPRFMRTIVTDDGVAASVCRFWHSLGYTYAAVLYTDEPVGTAFQQSIRNHCRDLGFKEVATFMYKENNEESVQAQVDALKERGIPNVMTVSHGTDVITALEAANANGMLGPSSLWIFNDGLVASDFDGLTTETKAKVQNSLRVAPSGGSDLNPRWKGFLEDWADFDPALLNRHYPGPWRVDDDFFEESLPGVYGELKDIGAFEYDAVAMVGLAACRLQPQGELPGDFGSQLFNRIDLTRFEGLTGSVAFDEIGNRDVATATFELSSVYTDREKVVFESVGLYDSSAQKWEFPTPIVYNSGGTTAPPDYFPPVPIAVGDDAVELTTILLAVGAAFGSVFLVGALFWVRYTYRRAEALRVEKEVKQLSQCKEAEEFVKEFQTPFVAITAAAFCEMGGLLQHESLRDRGVLQYYDHIKQDFFEDQFTVFFSHQWLGWSKPDPKGVQYEAMVACLKAIAAQKKKPLEEIYVWTDYYSIPQESQHVQNLAIVSLPCYASIAKCFVVIAPDAIHDNSGIECNKETYHSRCWCRAEALSHWARRGHSSMFYGSSDGLTPMAPAGVTDEFIQECINVMHGELTCCRIGHPNGMPCDREQLMLPMLGLYAEIYRSRVTNSTSAEIFEAIEPHLDAIFPKTIVYSCKVSDKKATSFIGKIIHGASPASPGKPGKDPAEGLLTKEVVLFGDLVEEMRNRVDHELGVAEKKSQLSMMLTGKRTATSANMGSAGRFASGGFEAWRRKTSRGKIAGQPAISNVGM